MEYKGYHAKYEIDEESSIIVGKILGISDLVTFESENVAGLKIEFESAVDDYLEFCKDVGKVPDKEYKGSFNVRLTPEKHREAAIAAERKGISLNQFVSDAIDDALDEKSKTQIKIIQMQTFKETKTLEAFADENDYSQFANYNKTVDYKVLYGGADRFGS